MTKHTEHTPGEWFAGESLTIWTRKSCIAKVAGPTDNDPESKANARLISAAPELLEALEHLMAATWNHFEYHHDGDDDCGSEPVQMAVDQARQAIRKARGQE